MNERSEQPPDEPLDVDSEYVKQRVLRIDRLSDGPRDLLARWYREHVDTEPTEDLINAVSIGFAKWLGEILHRSNGTSQNVDEYLALIYETTLDDMTRLDEEAST